MIQNLCDTAKAVLRGKLVRIQSYLKKKEKISNKQPIITPKSNQRKKNKQNTKLVEGKKS